MLWPFDGLDGPWTTIHTHYNPPLACLTEPELDQGTLRKTTGNQEPTTDGVGAQTEKSPRRQGCSPAACLGQDGNI